MGWLEDFRALHDSTFERHDWRQQVEALNDRLGLTGTGGAFYPSRWPPPLFVGDVDVIPSGRSVIVLSLNPRSGGGDAWEWYENYEFTPDSMWTYLSRRPFRGWTEADYYYRFYRPLVRLAATAIGEPDVIGSRANEVEFAWKRTAWVEICPYYSRRWGLGPEATSRLIEQDLACQLSWRGVEILIAGLRPRVLLVNGTSAVSVLERRAGERISWKRLTYASAHRETKQLWHFEGTLTLSGRVTPVVGFPFLRGPSTHNASSEIEQLSAAAHAHVATFR